MMILKRKFDTKFGVVTLSDSFYKLGCKLKQTEITYKPHDYNGWGITRTVNAIEVEDFTQADAEFFAEVAESKLRVNHHRSGPLSCKHGVILYGNECISCKRELGATL